MWVAGELPHTISASSPSAFVTQYPSSLCGGGGGGWGVGELLVLVFVRQNCLIMDDYQQGGSHRELSWSVLGNGREPISQWEND